MNIDIRIPTVQFGYLEFKFEGTPEEAIAEHERLLKAYNGGFGLETKEWNKVLDRYLKGDGMDSDMFEKLDKQQQWLIHEIDKSQSRINYKNT